MSSLPRVSPDLVFAPAYNFGQREHLFIILALPYFLSFGLAPFGVRVSTAERTALGLFSLFGFALKPFFLIPAILLTATLSWQSRSFKLWRDPANIAIGAGCVVYVLLTALIHPADFTTILPMGIAVYDWVATDTRSTLTRTIVPLLLVAATVTIVSERGRVRDLLLALSSVAFGLLLAFAVQRKIWDYQLLPFQSFAVVLATVAAVLTRDRILARPAHLCCVRRHTSSPAHKPAALRPLRQCVCKCARCPASGTQARLVGKLGVGAHKQCFGGLPPDQQDQRGVGRPLPISVADRRRAVALGSDFVRRE